MSWLIRHARTLLVAYLVVLAIVLLLPSDTLGSHGVTLVSEALGRLGLSDDYVLRAHVEFAENVLIIAPATLLASLLFPRFSWRDWTAFGFVASGAVELFQAVALSGRSATFSDVVANTAGALLGAAVAGCVRSARRAREASSPQREDVR